LSERVRPSLATVTRVRIKEDSEDDNIFPEQNLTPLVPLSTSVERGTKGERLKEGKRVR